MQHGSYLYEKHMYVKIGNVYKIHMHIEDMQMRKHIFMKNIDPLKGDSVHVVPLFPARHQHEQVQSC